MAVESAVERLFNFSAGPAAIPLCVLQQAQKELLSMPGCGASVMEISHRSSQFGEVMAKAEQRLRRLLGVPENYRVLFMQGGSRLQFSMVPMNLMGEGLVANYLLTGAWGKNALSEAVKAGATKVVWDGAATNYDRLPAPADVSLDANASYLYLTSNETIQGVQFQEDLDWGDVPVVCDMSSDFLSRPVDVSRYGLIFACAQKNAGLAGLTVVIIRDDLLQRSKDALPGYLNYRLHVDANSLWNTPPTFGIYLFGLIAKWLEEEIGGLSAMLSRNRDQAKRLYDVVDASDGFYQGHAQPDCRSLMNVTFRLPNDDLQSQFLSEAAEHHLDALKGHRSVGGIRASIYNAMADAGVDVLRQFMNEFRDRHANR
ncbi:MAG: 3-phosphoserine/phosphohydroxythreonine transaminase [Pirellulaceae bacterium]|jgi:phosphoserine aminotransferase|nr:3-phosphoserine/phosphohydroxythreonine transaminase [Pirellulaceae bacterium]HJN07405.1 3-phosphoserine/phosphohydroxythreonine transaminase [Pirellulaceae bacterium]